MRAVADTNIIVSGLLWAGVPRQVLDLGRSGRIEEQAATAAGLDRTDLLMALAREKVDAFPVDLAELAREISRE